MPIMIHSSSALAQTEVFGNALRKARRIAFASFILSCSTGSQKVAIPPSFSRLFAVHSVAHAGLNARDDERKYDSRNEGDREHQGKGKQGDLRPGPDVENIWTCLSYLGRKKFVGEEC